LLIQKTKGKDIAVQKRLPQGEGCKIHCLIINQATIESISNFTELSRGRLGGSNLYTNFHFLGYFQISFDFFTQAILSLTYSWIIPVLFKSDIIPKILFLIRFLSIPRTLMSSIFKAAAGKKSL